MRAPGHHREAVVISEVGEILDNLPQDRFDDRKSGSNLEYEDGIHDVLGRRPKMNKVGRAVAYTRAYLLHKRGDRDTILLHPFPESPIVYRQRLYA
jgi:hypothetical protein